MEIINATDGYKLGHHRMYPEGTEQVYSNWTPRSNKYFPEATEGSVVFGIQYLIKEYLIKQFEKNFFNLPKKEAVEAHSSRTFHLLGDRCLPWEFGHHSWIPAQSNIVFPDHGAKDRYGSNYSHYGYLVFKKERNLETGRIESFEIEESKNCYYSTFVFIDAGGTFLGELKVLKERYPNSKFIIIVCHAVNDKGLVNMCNNFDQVIVSNSHRDINYRPSNENLTVIDVCK